MSQYHNLTVYLGSSGHCRDVFKEAAQHLGWAIGAHRKHLIYGGMDAGLMGTLALATLEAGGKVTGIIPRKLKDSERILTNLNETILVEDLWDRKKRMFEAADAIISLPGGFGTLDESTEVLYWGQLGLHGKPLILVNMEDYFTPLISYFRTLPDFVEEFLIEVQYAEDALRALEDAPNLPRPLDLPSHYPHFEDEITRGTDEPIIVDKATIENTYFLVCALGLKQLDKTRRPIGILNANGQFDGLLEWLALAGKEHFITDHCLQLFVVDSDHKALEDKLRAHEHKVIDLHKDKWGAAVKGD